MSRNYFVRMHEIESGPIKDRRSKGYEIALVRQLAFFLTVDEEALQAMSELFLGSGTGTAVQVDRERAFQSGRPDLVIQLDTGCLLVLEAKLGASLSKEQLQRYLAIGDHGSEVRVALVSDRRQVVAPDVLANRSYCRPLQSVGDHFRWQHVHGILKPGSTRSLGLPEVRRQFAEYLSALGLGSAAFSAGWSDLFGDREDAICKRAQRTFGAILDGLATTSLAHLGRLHDNSHKARRF